MTRQTSRTTSQTTDTPTKPLRKRPRSRSQAAERAEAKLQRLIAQNRAEQPFQANDDMFNYNRFGRLVLVVVAGSLIGVLAFAYTSWPENPGLFIWPR